MLPTLTKRQKEILEYIRVFRELNGYSPSLEDIKKQFNLSAISTVHEHIQNLQKKGYLIKEINQARSIKPLENQISKKDFVEIPIMGYFEASRIVNPQKHELLVLPKKMLAKNGECFILINKNIIVNPDLKEGDHLVFLKKKSYKENDIVFATLPDGKYILGSKKKKGAQIFLTDFLTNKNYSKFTSSGSLILQIRNY